MSDDHRNRSSWQTRLVQSDIAVPGGFRSLAPAVHRGSTVVFDKLAHASDDWRGELYTYGLYGTPTTRELALRIADLEGAHRTFITPGGQAAILLIYLTFCRGGSHALIPDSAYGPNRELAEQLLAGLNITVEPYDPLIGAGIADFIRPETALIWCESPGSITMEVQDVAAISAAARARHVPVAIDNTYAAGILFDAFGAGVDVSMQALTKYVGGHSDLLLGSVSVANKDVEERVGSVHRLLGLAASPDDCALALRGLETLAVRLAHLKKSTFAIAEWCEACPEMALVLHPAFPACLGHEIWRRDFNGSASVFSIVFQPSWTADRVVAFVEGLSLFKIGYSWGGTTSLVMTYPRVAHGKQRFDGHLVRLNVGLEDTSELIADLKIALSRAAES